MVKAIFIRIYCMDYQDLLVLFTAFTGLFYIVWTKWGQRRIWKSAVILTLFGWAAVVLIVTIFQRTPNPSVAHAWQPFQSYMDALKEGGQRELLRSNFMNVVLFYPGGLMMVSLLPGKWHSWLKLSIVLLLFAGFSCAIEFVQHWYHLGLAQMDDVIHNVLGACLGAAVIILIPKIIRQIKIRRGETV